MTTYDGPPAATTKRRLAAMRAALDDLTPEARAEIEGRMQNLQAVKGCGSEAAKEIVAALAMMCGRVTNGVGEDAGDVR